MPMPDDSFHGPIEGIDLKDALAMLINDRVKSPMLIPMLGSSKALRDHPSTLHHGSLPHIILPWAFAVLWLLLLMSLGL